MSNHFIYVNEEDDQLAAIQAYLATIDPNGPIPLDPVPAPPASLEDPVVLNVPDPGDYPDPYDDDAWAETSHMLDTGTQTTHPRFGFQNDQVFHRYALPNAEELGLHPVGHHPDPGSVPDSEDDERNLLPSDTSDDPDQDSIDPDAPPPQYHLLSDTEYPDEPPGHFLSDADDSDIDPEALALYNPHRANNAFFHDYYNLDVCYYHVNDPQPHPHQGPLSDTIYITRKAGVANRINLSTLDWYDATRHTLEHHWVTDVFPEKERFQVLKPSSWFHRRVLDRLRVRVKVTDPSPNIDPFIFRISLFKYTPAHNNYQRIRSLYVPWTKHDQYIPFPFHGSSQFLLFDDQELWLEVSIQPPQYGPYIPMYPHDRHQVLPQYANHYSSFDWDVDLQFNIMNYDRINLPDDATIWY